LLLALVAYVASRVSILAFFTPLGSDIDVYCQMALNTVDLAQPPYTAANPVEYPPLGLRVLTLPRVVALKKVAPDEVSKQTFDRMVIEYAPVHRLFMLMFDAASLALFLATVIRRRPEKLAVCAWMYVVLTTILSHVILERMDVGLLFFLALWAAAWVRAPQSLRPMAWYTLAYAALGFGAAYKLIPALLMPPLVVGHWRAEGRRGWIKAGIGVLTFTVTCAAPFAIEAVRSGTAVLNVFTYHAERGTQIESLYASLLLPLRALGMPMHTSYDHRALELVTSISPTLAASSAWLLIGLVAASTLWMVLTSRPVGQVTAYRVALWLLPASLMVSKVLSPQFFIWALPMMVLLGLELFERRALFGFLGLLVVMAVLTTLVFPYHYVPQISWHGEVNPHPLSYMDPLACGLLLARNMVLVAVVVWTGVRVFGERSAAAATRKAFQTLSREV
jgi:hypothetical protein